MEGREKLARCTLSLENVAEVDLWGIEAGAREKRVARLACAGGNHVARFRARYHGLETRIVRIFNTYGPRMRAGDGRVVPAFICQALDNEELTVFGDGSQTRSFCYVDDLIEGIWRLLHSSTRRPCSSSSTSSMRLRGVA